MARLGKKRMGKKGEDRPLQTPNASSVSPAPNISNSKLNLEDVPVSGKTSPRLTTPGMSATPGSRPSTGTTIDTEKTREIMEKVDKASKTMEQNIQAATQRGESLNELQDKTQAVAESSKQFSKNAKTVKKNLWWKNMKFTIIIVFIILCVVAGIIVLIVIQNKLS